MSVIVAVESQSEVDVPDGRSCCYCGALLFEQESVVAAGTTERCYSEVKAC